MGADLMVRGAVGLARRAHVPPLAVALTVVAMGTSLPEFIVALQAIVADHPGILLGNVVGSNIANVLLVVGVTALVYPVRQGDSAARRDSLVMLAVSAGFVAIGFWGQIGKGAGVALLIALATVLVFTARDIARAQEASRGRRRRREWELGLPSHAGLIVLFLVVGVVGLPLGARLVVDSGATLANTFGVTDAVVGLTIVALSTSLPELATTVVAARRHETEVVMGTVIGSNIFNIVLIMGVAALVSAEPIAIPTRFTTLDLPLMFAAALVVTGYAWAGRPISRVVGGTLTLAYGVYVVTLYAF